MMKKSLLVVFFLLSLFSIAQQTDVVNFTKAIVDVTINPHQKQVKGNVVYTFDILKPTDSIYLDIRKNVNPFAVILNDKEIPYTILDNKLWLKTFLQPLKQYKLKIKYEATPKKAMYFIGWDNEGKNQVWTQGQGKYTSHWLPSIDDVNDKIEFDLSISFHKDYEVIANGKLLKKETINDSLVKWQYDMKASMSSYLVALAIGKYAEKTEISKSGVPLMMYYYPEDSNKFEATYRYTKKMFDFFETEIGVPYPWQNYKQIPVKDFLYAGMENTGTTIFSDTFMVDDIAFLDKNYVNVNAHELAHQWFGNMVTATSSTHHWLQEGFATYYALLAEKEVFGEDYYYYKLYQSAKQLAQQKDTKLLNPKASSLVFYQKGAWVLHRLRELIGDKAFQKSVAQYLEKYKFKEVETLNFINIVKGNTTINLSDFEGTWLNGQVFPVQEANESLSKNKTLRKVLKTPLKYCSKQSEIVQQEVLKNIAKDSTIALSKKIKTYKKAFEGSVKVRQVLSEIIEEVPSELKIEMESLLTDKSYKTIENALFKLWAQFPKNREKYLNQTKGIIGFKDKNIKIVWLTLALSTPDYEDDFQSSRLQELITYTAPKYHFEVRKNAFEYLKLMHFCNDEVLNNLEEATHHHNWRFKKFAVRLKKELQNKK